VSPSHIVFVSFAFSEGDLEFALLELRVQSTVHLSSSFNNNVDSTGRERPGSGLNDSKAGLQQQQHIKLVQVGHSCFPWFSDDPLCKQRPILHHFVTEVVVVKRHYSRDNVGHP
jgi:hypothetical protein